MITDTEQKVKVFLEAWNLRGGEVDTKASCQVCGAEITDGNFALTDGVLMCLKCREHKFNGEIGSAGSRPRSFSGKK